MGEVRRVAVRIEGIYERRVPLVRIEREARLIDADVVHILVGDDPFITSENLPPSARSCSWFCWLLSGGAQCVNLPVMGY